MNNGLSDDELNKINKLKQKLYSRSLVENASKLNALHKHDLKVATSWDEEKPVVKDVVPQAGNEKKRACLIF